MCSITTFDLPGSTVSVTDSIIHCIHRLHKVCVDSVKEHLRHCRVVLCAWTEVNKWDHHMQGENFSVFVQKIGQSTLGTFTVRKTLLLR